MAADASGRAEPMPVAIVSFNTRAVLRQCLRSLDGQAGAVWVYDNASTDGTLDMLAAEFPHVRVTASQRNEGFGAAANRLLADCQSEAVLLLNPDTQLAPNALFALRAYLDQQPTTAIVGPRLINPDGSLQASCFPFPSPLYALLRATLLGRLMGRLPGLRQWYLPTWDHATARPVPWVLGAALAIRLSAFRAVGGFDEAFFMYSEEVDLCYRLRAAGWRVDFAPVTNVMHLGGASTSQYASAMEAQRYASTAQFYQAHYARWRHGLLKLVVSYEMARNLVRDTWRRRRAADRDRRRLADDIAVWKRIWRQTWQTAADENRP